MRTATTQTTADEKEWKSKKKRCHDNKKNVSRKEIPPSYHSFASPMTEAPMFDICCSNLLGGSSSRMIRSIISFLYKLRWMMSYPLRTRIIPRNSCITRSDNDDDVSDHSSTNKSYRNGSCFLHPTTWWYRRVIVSCILEITIGEILLCTPILLCCIEGYVASSFFHQSSVATASSISNTGTMATYLLFLTYTSANKSNSLFTFVFGIPFERMICYHRICSICAVVISIVHIATCHSLQRQGGSQSTTTTEEMVSYLVQDRTNTAGTVATVCMILLVTMSIHSKILRQYAFQMWLSSHILLAVFVLIALFLHGVYTGVFVALWWLLDIIVRYGIMTICQYRISSNEVQLRRIAPSTHTLSTIAVDDNAHNNNNNTHEPAIEISFPKPIGFNYSAGQFVQIAIPAISIFEFHPVSLSSAPHENMVTMHIRQRGDWTRKLVQLSESKNPTTTTISTPIWMEGPYGSLSVDIHDAHRYQMVLLICGGIGVTPCQSIGKSILYAHTQCHRPLKYMQMVWSVRDMNIVHDIPPLIGKEPKQLSSKDAIVQIDIYCTRTGTDTDTKAAFSNDVDIETTTTNAIQERPVDQDESYNYNIIHGQRPNMDHIFRTMQQTANEMGESNIAVIGCGPTALMDDIRIACRKYSQSSVSCSSRNGSHGVYFDLHTEHFEY